MTEVAKWHLERAVQINLRSQASSSLKEFGGLLSFENSLFVQEQVTEDQVWGTLPRDRQYRADSDLMELNRATAFQDNVVARKNATVEALDRRFEEKKVVYEIRA